MKLTRWGVVVGILCATGVEITRQVTLQSMEGEGSAIATWLVNAIVGFPLSVVASPLLEYLQGPLDALPGPAAYAMMLLVTVLNWSLLGFAAQRFVDRRRQGPTKRQGEAAD